MSRRGRVRKGAETLGGISSVPIVAIGASAGGLEAASALLAKLPSDSGMAFVLIQHRDPARPSALVSLLSKVTSLPVREISNKTAIQANHVYVVPPNKRASIRKETLSLGPVKSQDRSHSIDHFMAALAAARGEAAIGVILSGTGSDGTQGLAAIKAADGFTFAQDPKTAQWPAMPQSAIEAGFVDFVFRPARIALAVVRLGGSPSMPPGPFSTAEFDKIFQILRAATGIDFHHYKQSTVVRRILRQMALHGIKTLSQYAVLLQNRKEAELLADRIFVPLTRFFRDPASFRVLRAHVRSMLRRTRRSESVRVWVEGCSTGEEVYSLAMLLVEEMGPGAKGTAVQLFGTDIRERALQYARAGIYPEAAVTDISPARLKRFFIKSGSGYQVSQALRDLCIFARHDLTRDPPFSNLDLISCRNVLPYLRPAFQDRALTAFRYALKPRAFLFTDTAVAAKTPSGFTVKDAKHGILSRMPDERTAVREAQSARDPSKGTRCKKGRGS